jgi:hypothetical protein
MRSRHVARLRTLVPLAVTALAVLAAGAPASAIAAPAGGCATPARSDIAAAQQPERVQHISGSGCGTAVNDASSTPQIATGQGTIVLSGIGRASFDTTVASTPAGFDFFTHTGTFTLTTARGSISFVTSGSGDGLDPVVGDTSHLQSTFLATGGTDHFTGVGGTLQIEATLTLAAILTPTTILIDIVFTVDGTLTFPHGQP